MEVNSVLTSSMPVAMITMAVRPGPPSSPALRHTEPTAKLAAAMPV